MKVKLTILLLLAALIHCRKPDRPEQLIFRDGFVVGNDTTPPQVVSVTGEAGTDQLLVEFTEPVYTTSAGAGNLVLADFGYQDNNVTGATSLTSMFEANGADRVVVITTNANLIAGDNGDRVTFPANSIYDAAGNALAATDKLIVLTIVPPTLVGAETMDTNRNGKIDHLKLTFNKNLNDATFPNYVNTSTLGGVTAAWLVSGFTNVRIDPTIAADVDNDNIIFIAWDEGAVADTALKPDLTTTAAPGLQATTGATVNQIVSGTVAETDGAAPVLVDATEKAGEKDLVLSFSEPVYTNNNATGALVLGDFSFTNSNPTGATAISSITEADGSDKSITIQMDALFVNGDHLTDRIAVVSSEIFDTVGLAAVNCQTGTHCAGTYITTRITSGDAPVLQSAETMDIDGNGKIDHYKLTFDVPVNDVSFPGHAGNNALGTTTTQWLIAGRSNVRIDTRDAAPPTGPGDNVTNDNVIYLAFDESVNACSGNDISGCDSGAKPDITTTATPGLSDFDPTNFPQLASGGVVETDKAPPKLITLKGHGNATSLVAYFSEAVFTNTGGTGDLVAADFNYQNDNAGGATAITGLSEANGGDGRVTLTTTGSFVIGDDNTDDLVAATNAIYDAGNNALVSTTPVRVVPLLLSAETMDINSDGTIDHYKLTFSMPVDDTSFPGYAGVNALGTTTTTWLIANQGNVRIDTRDTAPPIGPGDTGTNDAVIYVEFTGSSKTDMTPDLTTTTSPALSPAGGTATLLQISTGDIIEQDKAPPAIVSAIAATGTTSLQLVFSERIYTNPGSGDAFDISDFSYNNTNATGAASLVGLTEANGMDGKLILTLNAPFGSADHNSDQIAVAVNQVFDASGNEASASRNVTGLPRLVGNGTVSAVVENNGILYISGTFTRLGRHSGSAAFLNDSDGQQTVYMTERIHGSVNAAIPDGNGGYYIGGTFTQIGSTTRNRIARINADGSLHSWNPNADNSVSALALSGSTLYVGGTFGTIGGQSRSRLAALDTTSGSATAWNPSPNGDILALLVSGSTVYAGGTFGSIGGQARPRIAALDASTGNATAWDANANGDVACIALSGATLYVGGGFTNIGGQARQRIAGLDTTTASATAFNPTANISVSTLAVSGSTVYAGGYFTFIGGQSRNYLAALDASTGAATAWNPNPNARVTTLVITGSTMLAGGMFTSIGGQGRYSLAALDISTGNANSWQPNPSDSVTTITVSGSTVFVGGTFSSITATSRNRIAAIDVSTGELKSWNPNSDGVVNTLAVAGTNIYAGGGFTTIGGQPRNRIAAIDATTGNATAWNPNSSSTVNALLADGSTVYAGGNFSSIGGASRNYIAALDASTGSATTWNPNASGGIVLTIAKDGNTVYAGGSFSSIGGASRNRIAAIDATTGIATAWNPDAGNVVHALAVSGSLVYAAGTFPSIGINVRGRMAAIDAATGVATGWNPNANGAVYTLQISGTRVFAGGDFTTIGGASRSRIAALDISTGTANSWNPAANSTVNALLISGENIYAGGAFTNVGAQSMSNFVTIDNTTGSILEY
ncbi:MAG: beta strand repeat-containing protein [Spirochaetota bacterium]